MLEKKKKLNLWLEDKQGHARTFIALIFFSWLLLSIHFLCLVMPWLTKEVGGGIPNVLLFMTLSTGEVAKKCKYLVHIPYMCTHTHIQRLETGWHGELHRDVSVNCLTKLCNDELWLISFHILFWPTTFPSFINKLWKVKTSRKKTCLYYYYYYHYLSSWQVSSLWEYNSQKQKYIIVFWSENKEGYFFLLWKDPEYQK